MRAPAATGQQAQRASSRGSRANKGVLFVDDPEASPDQPVELTARLHQLYDARAEGMLSHAEFTSAKIRAIDVFMSPAEEASSRPNIPKP